MGHFTDRAHLAPNLIVPTIFTLGPVRSFDWLRVVSIPLI